MKLRNTRKYPTYTKIIEKSTLEGIRIGVSKNYFFDHLNPGVESLFYDFIETLKSIGSVVYDLDLHNTEKYYGSWREIRLAEAGRNTSEVVKHKSGGL